MSNQKKWDELYEEASREVQCWRRKHRKATLTEIENTVDNELAKMRARMIQDLALARQQDVAANIFLGREPVRRLLGVLPVIDRAAIEREARFVFGDFEHIHFLTGDVGQIRGDNVEV